MIYRWFLHLVIITTPKCKPLSRTYWFLFLFTNSNSGSNCDVNISTFPHIVSRHCKGLKVRDVPERTGNRLSGLKRKTCVDAQMQNVTTSNSECAPFNVSHKRRENITWRSDAQIPETASSHPKVCFCKYKLTAFLHFAMLCDLPK